MHYPELGSGLRKSVALKDILKTVTVFEYGLQLYNRNFNIDTVMVWLTIL